MASLSLLTICLMDTVMKETQLMNYENEEVPIPSIFHEVRINEIMLKGTMICKIKPHHDFNYQFSLYYFLVNRRQELTNLYGKIVKEFPFLANQGLLRPGDRKVSIDDLLSMSVFGQPKMGKK